MSMLDVSNQMDEIEAAEEPTIAETGEEYKLRIISCREGTDKNDLNYFAPLFEVVGAPMVKEFSGFLHVPNKGAMDEKKYKRSLYAIKVFAETFGIDLSRPVDYEDDLPGLEGWAILGSKTDDTYGEQNTIRKYIASRWMKLAEVVELVFT